MEPRLSSTTLVQGTTQTLELRPTVPVLCRTGRSSCRLTLFQQIPTHYTRTTCEVENDDAPFADRNCGAFIVGHIDGTDMNDYLRTPNNLTVYGKVTYQIGGIDTRTFILMLYVPPTINFQHSVWNGFSINTTVSFVN